MSKKFYIFSLLILMHSLLLSQHEKRHLKHVLKDAQYYLDADNYFKALQLYKEVLQIEPTHLLAGVDAAYCIEKLNYPIDSTLFLENNLIQTTNIDAKYYLAKIAHRYKQFDEAIHLLREYKKTDRKHHLETDDEIEYLIQVCENGKVLMGQGHKASIKNIGSEINSIYDDYVPVITPDESIMYFTSKRQGGMNENKNGDNKYFEDIYVSKRINGHWQAAENAGFPLNTENNDACVALNVQGNKMIVYRTTSDGSGGHLYLSQFGSHHHWEALEPLDANINSEYIETSACFSDDSSTIYFSSNKPGGFGGKDIYRINKLPNGKWGVAYNLGPTINTKYDEDAPFLNHNGTSLYFSSKGHNTMGEYDVFKSQLNASTQQFSSVENLGYPINDVGNDIFFTINADETTGYYSSIKASCFGGEDIYVVDMRYNENDIVVKEGTVLLEGEVGRAKITIKNEQSGELVGEYFSNGETGKFILAINPLNSYKMVISAEGFEKIRTHFNPLDVENNPDFFKFNLKKKNAQ